MQINPIRNDNMSFGINTSFKKIKTPYEEGLDELILKEYGNIFPVREYEDYTRFVKTTENFKRGNDALLASCGVRFSPIANGKTYEDDLDKLILKEFGNIYMVREPEDCKKFVAAINSFKRANADLLQKHFDIVV